MLTPDAKPAFGQESLNGTATLFPCNQDGTTTPAPGLSRILTARVRDQETARGGGTWAGRRCRLELYMHNARPPSRPPWPQEKESPCA